MLAGVGDELEEVRRPVTDASGGFAAARERRSADDATQRRPSHRRSARGLPLPSARCHPRREPLGAERALCRRRARAATPPWTGAITPRPTRISGGTAPVHLTDAAWPPKLLAKPLPRRNCSPEQPRSRPPLEPPINRGPELQLVPTPPLHSTKTLPSHWKIPEEVSFLNSGRRDPPRDPARFAPVRAPPPFNSCQ